MRTRLFSKLEIKFVLLATVVILLASTVANFLIFRTARERTLQEAYRRAKLLAEATAISFTNTLIYEEVGLVEEGGLMENHIEGLIKNKEAEVRDVVVFNNKGQTIAANNYAWYHISRDNPQLLHAMATQELTLTQDFTDNPQEIDVIAPLRIGGKRFGTLIMHFSLQREYAYLAAFRHRLFLLTIMGMVGAIVLAIFTAKALARPIKRLAAEMAAISDTNLSSSLVSTRMDEIGQLERGFLKMLQRLRNAAEEREKSQQALIQAEKLAALGTLVAGVAHEINNPLAGLYNCLRRIQAHPEDTEQIRKYVKLMHKALSHIENIVRNLLNLSRQKQGPHKPVDLNRIVSDALDLLDYRLRKQGIEKKVRLAKNLPQISGDAGTLEQVFVNLMMNASDAMPDGGTLTITTKANTTEVIVEVADTGTGIPDSELGKIFDPFYTTKDVGQGTGLGLSISKKYVENHSGTIEVETSLNRGSTFRVRLPITRRELNLQKPRVCIAILAGGRSSRMGRNKALVELDGKNLIEYVVEVARKAANEILLITNSPKEYAFLNLPMFPDEIKNIGPLGGIYTALKACNTSHCLVIACDLPFLSEELIRFLVENAGDTDVFALDVGRGAEVLCAVYSKACLPAIESLVARGDYKVANLLQAVKSRVIRFGPGHSLYSQHLFYNINTPEDLSRAQKLLNKLESDPKS